MPAYEAMPTEQIAVDDDVDDEAKALQARMRQAEHRAAVETWQILEDKREALLHALDVAFLQYRWPWAQTTVDMIFDFFHESRAKFSTIHQTRLVELWEKLRDKRNARKGIGGKSDLTSFEQGQAQYAGASISVRKSVGSESRVDGRGESCAIGL